MLSFQRLDVYKAAIEEMFDKTSTVAAPWHVVEGNDKHYARIRVLEVAAKILGEGVDISTPVLDPDVAEAARERLGIEVQAEKKRKKK